MQREVEPEYSGSFVTLRPVGSLYAVAIEPPISGCDCEPRSFGCKQSAWFDAQCRWSEYRLPFTDFTDGNTGRELLSENSEK